jgi:precorrin-2 dehydrogenase/sirohydrochlorin ferrochelatase
MDLRYDGAEDPNGGYMNCFPIMLRLAGRACVVVGAGRVAAEKAAGLLRYGAEVVVVAPKAVRWIRENARAGKLVWRRRMFSSRDLRGAFLVVAATDSAASNHAVFHACQTQGVLCNAVDDPEHCDFFYPAVVRRGPLQIAISTNGNSPALAARLRKELERQFGPEWGAFVKNIGKLRQQLLSASMPLKKRREQIMGLAGQKALRSFQRQLARATRRHSR